MNWANVLNADSDAINFGWILSFCLTSKYQESTRVLLHVVS